MPGERELTDAVIAALDPALGQWSAFRLDDEALDGDAALPAIFVVVHVARRFGAPLWMHGGRPAQGWRVLTRHVGTTVREAQWAAERVAGVLQDKPITVGAETSEPFRFETEDVIGQDEEGYFTGAVNWTTRLS